MSGHFLPVLIAFLSLSFLNPETLANGQGISYRTTDSNCTICKLLNVLLNRQTDMSKKLDVLAKQNEKLQKKVDLLLGSIINCSEGNLKDCADVYHCGQTTSGVYTIYPEGQNPFNVFCDQATSGGGWTVFQKRLDGSVDFYRSWDDYKNGFGILSSEYWLGLDKLNKLTTLNQKRYTLRVDLEDTAGNTDYAEYSNFAVSSESSKYQMSLGTYSGTAGDALSSHKNRPFTTKDRDNDEENGNCAVMFHGAWWYEACHNANLNGDYLLGEHSSYANGVNWKPWKGYHYSAKRAEMKIRPVDWTPA